MKSFKYFILLNSLFISIEVFGQTAPSGPSTATTISATKSSSGTSSFGTSEPDQEAATSLIGAPPGQNTLPASFNSCSTGPGTPVIGESANCPGSPGYGGTTAGIGGISPTSSGCGPGSNEPMDICP